MSAAGRTISSPLTSETASHRASLSPLAIWKVVLLAWLTSRLWIAIFAYLGHSTHPFREKIPGGWEGVSSWWLNVWTTYDSSYFLRIAAQGYTPQFPQDSAFFPLYSLVLRPFGPDSNAMALWGIVVSNLCFAGALWLLYDLTRHDYNEEVARRTVWITAFFPTGAFAMSVYTESFYLLLAVATFWCVRRTKWLGVVFLVFWQRLHATSGPFSRWH